MNIKKTCILSGILLLLAIPPVWPYGYYQLLRLLIFATSALVAWGFYKSKLTPWAWIFGSVTFLFNPLIPIHFDKSSWVPIDFISAMLFFLAAYSVKKYGKNERSDNKQTPLDMKNIQFTEEEKEEIGNGQNTKISVEELANLLSQGVVKGLEDITVYKKLFPKTPEVLLKQEVAALNAFEILLATSSYYKDSTRGPEIFQAFLKKYEEKLIESKMFSDISTCDKFMETRIKAYDTAVKHPKNNNPLEDLSFMAVQYFGNPTISNAVALTEIFANSLIATKRFIEQSDPSVI